MEEYDGENQSSDCENQSSGKIIGHVMFSKAEIILDDGSRFPSWTFGPKIHYHAEPRESEVPYFLAQELIPGYWGDREGTYCPPKGYFVADEHPEARMIYGDGYIEELP